MASVVKLKLICELATDIIAWAAPQASYYHQKVLASLYYLNLEKILYSLQQILDMSSLIEWNPTRILLVASGPGSNAGHIYDKYGKFFQRRAL